MEKKKRIRKKTPCPICGILKSYNAIRCMACSAKIRGAARVAKGLRKINKCIDCGKEIAKKKYTRCHSCSMLDRWLDPEYQSRCIDSMKESFYSRWSDPVYREKSIKNLTNFIDGSKLERSVALIAKDYGFERSVMVKKYLVDLIDVDRKIIVEVNGDVWHCNPKFYKPEDVIISKKTAKQVWEKDSIRKNFLQSLGYRVYEIWEDDILKGKSEYIHSFFNSL